MMRYLLVFAVGLMMAGQGLAANPDFLQARGSELYLNGKPFYEISFNKFDLFWQMMAAEFHKSGFGSEPAVTGEKALKDLNRMGFKTLRVVFNVAPEYYNPALRPRFYSVMDRTLDLCDKYDIRLVFSMGMVDMNYSKECGETYLEFLTNPASKSRQKMHAYATDLITRYRDRKTIAMWEHGNELLLKADIGGKTRNFGGIMVPTLPEVAEFHRAETEFIRTLDKSHPTTSGDSYRNSIWSLYESAQGKTKNGWGINTMQDIAKGVSMAQKGVDVFCIHNYYKGPAYGCHTVMGPDGKLKGLNMADWTAIARAEGKPLYVGEYSAMPLARTDANKKRWEENPEWFESYEGADREKAIKMVKLGLEDIVKAKPNLTHWWCYQSNRNSEQKNPQRFDIDPERTPELVRAVMDANRRLQMATMGFTYMKDNASVTQK